MELHRRFRALGAFLAVVLLLGACGGSATRVTGPAPNPADAAAELRGYELGSGDRVRVTVFRHADLSGEFEVDGQGNLAMPLAGEVRAGGKTARELEREVATVLEDGYLVDPQVSVEILNYRPFYILGEVRNPGSYPYVSGMTVLNAAALAGGYTPRARTGSLNVTRGGANGHTFAAGGDTPILPGDIIEVPERFF